MLLNRFCDSEYRCEARLSCRDGRRVHISEAMRFALIAVALIAALFAPVSFSSADTSLQVDAGTDLQPLMAYAFIPMFTKQTGIEVNATFGASGSLQKQFEDGAPIDVFLADDDTTVGKLAKEGLLDGASEQSYATGRLAVMFRRGFEARQVSMSALAQQWVNKVAIADPAVSGYGRAAQTALVNADLYSTVNDQERLALFPSAQDAYVNTVAGNADATITALSLVIRDKKANYEMVPARYYTPINQTLGIKPNASQPAKQFVVFLLSPDAQAIFKQFGYLPPKTKK